MENCPKCDKPMEEGHVCAVEETTSEAPVVEETTSEAPAETPAEGGEETPETPAAE